jgi:hypothetical protein
VAKQLGMNEQLCEFLKQRFVLVCFKELKITEKKFVAHDEINVYSIFRSLHADIAKAD